MSGLDPKMVDLIAPPPSPYISNIPFASKFTESVIEEGEEEVVAWPAMQMLHPDLVAPKDYNKLEREFLSEDETMQQSLLDYRTWLRGDDYRSKERHEAFKIDENFILGQNRQGEIILDQD